MLSRNTVTVSSVLRVEIDVSADPAFELLITKKSPISIPLRVTAVPTTLASLKYEFSGM